MPLKRDPPADMAAVGVPGRFARRKRLISGRGLEADRLPYAGRVDQGEDGEDDVLGERSPDPANALESGVNRWQIVQIGARVALLRRCQRDGRNP